MTLRVRFVVGFVCALSVSCFPLSARPVASSPQARRVEPLGAFEASASKERPIGYRVLLWRDGGEVLGLFSTLGGNAERPPTGRLEGVEYAPSTGRFGFRAHLWLAYDGDGLRLADADYRFEGTVSEDAIAGVLDAVERLQQMHPQVVSTHPSESIRLARLAGGIKSYKNRAGWERMAEEAIGAPRTETLPGRSVGIRGAGFRAAMTGKFLAESDDPCDTENKVTLESVQFGDLDGEPGEEALVSAFSCLAGNGGVDLWGIFRMESGGALKELPIRHPDEDRPAGTGLYSGLRGHVRLRIDSGRFVEEYPLYAPEDPNSFPSLGFRRFIYRWDGHRFLLAKTEDVGPGDFYFLHEAKR